MDVSLSRHAEDSEPMTSEDTRASTGRSAWRWAAPAAVFLLGCVLRVAYITHESAGYNESITMWISQLPRREMMHQLVADFFHPPLHTLLLRGWSSVFGFGILQARLLSALFGSLAVIQLYFLSQYLFDRRTALLSSMVLAVSQLSIWFSQEPRPFAQQQFLVLLSAYLFIRALWEQRPSFWWGFTGCTVLMMYTDYYSVFVVAALVLCALIYRRSRKIRLSWFLGGGAIVVALYLPWAASGIVGEAAANPQTFGGKQSYMAVHWDTILTAVNTFNNGKPEGLDASSPPWTFVLGALLFCVPVALTLKRCLAAGRAGTGSRASRGVVIASMLFLIPLCAIIGLGFTLHVQYKVRYVLICAAPYYLLVGRGISELRLRTWRWIWVALLLAYSANSLRATYFKQWKENFRDAFAYVESNRKDGDCGIFVPGFDVPYQWTMTEAGRPSPFRIIPRDGLAAGLSSCGRLWVVAGANSENAMSWAYAAKDRSPVEATHLRIDGRRYFGLDVGLYVRKEN
jgi:Dolichyl-phosphate-mannose-protein mannosyltransferase